MLIAACGTIDDDKNGCGPAGLVVPPSDTLIDSNKGQFSGCVVVTTRRHDFVWYYAVLRTNSTPAGQTAGVHSRIPLALVAVTRDPRPLVSRRTHRPDILLEMTQSHAAFLSVPFNHGGRATKELCSAKNEYCCAHSCLAICRHPLFGVPRDYVSRALFSTSGFETRIGLLLRTTFPAFDRACHSSSAQSAAVVRGPSGKLGNSAWRHHSSTPIYWKNEDGVSLCRH